MPPGEIGKLSQPGVPLKDKDGAIVGAIGVSGKTEEDDHTEAIAGVQAL
jgi:uncharacterized protein GlcG (DUF336 family)